MMLRRYDLTTEPKITLDMIDLDNAVWDRIDRCGETRFAVSIQDSPVYHLGPIAIYRVYTESTYGDADSVRLDESDEIVTNWAVRWIGWRKVRA